MRILLTNDDGIRAPGIEAMHAALCDLPRPGREQFGGPLLSPRDTSQRAPRSVVEVIAPLTVQSATGHGVTFHTPLMIRHERVHDAMQGIAVDARPADCVKVALSNLWGEKYGVGQRPDLVVSGMNAGANCGINVVYSGTVAAALEAAFLGVPSIAVSMRMGASKPLFDVAAGWGRRAIERVLSGGLLRPHECVSINIPSVGEGGSGGDVSPERMPPIKVCPMNTHGLVDQYERRVSPMGDVYYWSAGSGLDFAGTEPGTDVDWLLKGCITVTPLMYDLTRHHGLAELAKRVEG